MDISFTALHRAYRDCRRTKRNTANALAFEIDAEANLLKLQTELRERTYRPGPSICFVTDGPKPREVFAADFRDRVVHHLLVGHQMRHFEPRFIHDSYACRADKGVLAASDRLMTFLRRATANGRRAAWAIKLDVASFFPSIDKSILFDLLCQRERDAHVRWLTQVVLFHDPTRNYGFRPGRRHIAAPGCAAYPVPPRKSLFHTANQRGLPIGNLTSQFWANVYLNQLDQFAKRELGCRYYVRYVDDVVLLADSPDRLRAWRESIRGFLRAELRLDLRRAPCEPTPVKGGVDFVGWKTWWSHRLVRRQTLATLRGRLRGFSRVHTRRAFAGEARRAYISRAPLMDLQASLASYSGHLRYGAVWGEWSELWRDHAWLRFVVRVDGWRVKPRWRALPTNQAGLDFAVTYRRLARDAGSEVLVLACVGRFVECYGPQRLLARSLLDLPLVALPRYGYAFLAGVRASRAPTVVRRALRRGSAVVLARPARPAIELLMPNAQERRGNGIER